MLQLYDGLYQPIVGSDIEPDIEPVGHVKRI